uniref:Uncharacterized protein n=1 Tax=Picea sitchensis TaxID=3332 RepID=A9NZX4_PICSI|nr:unknown [Picea sitchensis]
MEICRSRAAAMRALIMAVLVMIVLLADGAAAAHMEISPSPSLQAGGAASSSLPSLAALLIAPLVAYCIY